MAIGRFVMFCLRATILCMTIWAYWEFIKLIIELRARILPASFELNFDDDDEIDDDPEPIPFWDFSARSEARSRKEAVAAKLEKLEKEQKLEQSKNAWVQGEGEA